MVNSCIGWCGKTITGLFRKAIISTTALMSHIGIMTLATCGVSPGQNIKGLTYNRRWPRLAGSPHIANSGGKSLSVFSSSFNLRSISANVAAISSWLKRKGQLIVVRIVEQQQGGQVGLMTKQEFASNVASHLESIAIETINAAPIHVLTVMRGNLVADVYDLQIEDVPEFFANGILVHNSKFKYPQEAWDNLMLGLRMGDKPQAVVSTTPRPIKAIKELVKDERTEENPNGRVAVTRGHTLENADNLAPDFLRYIMRKYEGTRLGRQELAGEILDDNPNALWQRGQIDELRVTQHPALARIVVGVDPAASDNEDSAETGIIVAGIAPYMGALHGYILDDLTIRGSPNQWATAVVTGYYKFLADKVIAEVNNGGAMVENTVRMVDKSVAYKAVHASRGKYTRAEPVSALYEQCVAQGTLISTMLGDIPIEDVHAGDYVWTREGLRRVLWAGETGIKPTLRLITEMGELTCTENHPVHTVDRGFIQAGQLVPKCDILTVWNYLSVQNAEPVHHEKVGVAGLAQPRSVGKHGSLNGLMLHSMASDIISKRMGIGEPVDIQGINYCIERYGNQCMALSLKGGISTMTTETQAIMNLKILSLFRRQSIVQNTRLIRHLPMELLSGCRRPERTGGNAVSHNLTFAKSVDASLRRRRHGCDSAPQPVTHGIGVGAVEKGPSLSVYNLTVEDTPEYFANGILVHNCRVHHVGFFPELEDQLVEWVPGDTSPDRLDALVWALTELMLEEQAGEWRRL